MSYIKYNANPEGRKIGDCVVRAFCCLLDKEWDEVFKDLCEIAFEMKAMPNDDIIWKEYAKQNGFKYQTLGRIRKGQKRPKVKEFAESRQDGNLYILVVANHIVPAYDSNYYDLFDSGNSAMYGYWEKEGE